MTRRDRHTLIYGEDFDVLHRVSTFFYDQIKLEQARLEQTRRWWHFGPRRSKHLDELYVTHHMLHVLYMDLSRAGKLRSAQPSIFVVDDETEQHSSRPSSG